MADIDLSGLQRWADDPAGPIGRDMARRALRVTAAAKRLAPVHNGRLRAAIGPTMVVRGARGPVVDVVAAVAYAAVVHDGRRPGARMPPVAVIETWAARRGMPGAGFVIARAISRRGIPGRPYLRDALPAALN